MLQCGSFSAWIEVDGVKLKTYEEQVSNDGNHTTAWIASEEGKSFSVNWRDTDRRKASRGDITIDTKACKGRIMHSRDERGKERRDTVCKSYFREGKHEVRPFVFTRLQTTDDDHFLDAHSSTGMGDIMLKITPVKLLSRHKYDLQPREAPTATVIHEKSKKAGMHCVSFGVEQRKEAKYTCRTATLKGSPQHTFIFKYRPLDVLRAMNVVPPSAKKRRREDSPASQHRDGGCDVDIDLTLGEEAEVIDMYNEELALKARLAVLREERIRLESAKKAKVLKTERSSSCQFTPGEIIDLT